MSFVKTVNWYWENAWNNRALLNIGDAAEYKVVDQLLEKIDRNSSRHELSIDELKSYRGEDLIVPLNIALDSYIGYNSILDNLSPNIIPVFLGMSFAEPRLNPEQIACLKRYQPIGCRDERSYQLMVENGIDAYLNGCMVSIIETDKIVDRQASSGKDILFIDVPSEIKEFVPESIKRDAKFISQELYIKKGELGEDFDPDLWFKSVLDQYADAKLIVTSRFHGAVIALAMGIPVIVTLEKKTFRFSWLSNFCQIVTKSHFDEIVWDVKSYDYTQVKNLMSKIAIDRISETTDCYSDRQHLTELMTDKCKEENDSSNQVLYYHKVKDRIISEWNKTDEIKYAIWGLNDNAMHLQELIRQEYPNAKLVAVLDMFKETEYEGIRSIHPREYLERLKENNTYLLVTAYLASRVVKDIFGDDENLNRKIYKCERDLLQSFDS